MNFKKRLTSAIATGAVLLNALAPMAYASEIVISGNGAGSDNVANVSQNTTTTVTQSNNANITNNVNAEAKTGENNANFNTGGDVVIGTGNAHVSVNVSNDLNHNVADVNCCEAGNTTVNISGNGAFSDNTANVRQNSTTTLRQNNRANVTNNVDAEAETGDNNAGFNTGGDITIVTGNATVNANVSTLANVNSARIGPALGAGSGTGVSLLILDNGAGSDNRINANLSKTTTLGQTNNADIDNNVEAEAETGENDANFNTGDGDVVILTGNAKVNAAVDNAVNFNFADVDCGCVYDLTAKIAGNGAAVGFQSVDTNVIRANLNSLQVLAQGNLALLTNNLGEEDELDADTGDNEASRNTAGSDTDPAVVTGNATVNSGVSNSGNVNVLGSLPDFPELPDFDFEFNMSALLAFFGMISS